MGMPSIHYVAKDRRWEFRNRGGVLTATITDDKATKFEGKVTVVGTTLTAALAVGSTISVGGGNAIAKILAFTGSMIGPTVTVGSTAIGTITNATGVAPGDIIMVSPGTLLSSGGVLGAWAPTANILHVCTTGSIPTIPWHVVVFKKV